MTPPTHLHSMPLNLDAWGHIVAGTSARDEGILFKAVRTAWTAQHRGEPACTLPAEPSLLRALIGDRAAVRIVRRFFVPMEGAPHLLAWPWLTAAWETAMAKYQRRRLAGVESGQTRRHRTRSERKPRDEPSSNARALFEQCSNNQNQTVLKNRTGDGTAAGRGNAAAAPSLQRPGPGPRDHPKQHAAEQWLREQPPDVATALERDVDVRLRADQPSTSKLDIAHPMFAAVRARLLQELVVAAYLHSTQEVACNSPPAPTHLAGVLTPGVGQGAAHSLTGSPHG